MDTPLVIQIDRALAQTHKAGLRYAAIPMPWLLEWGQYVDEVGTRFEVWDTCFGSELEDALARGEQDGNGNFLLCLLPVDHEGRHGFEFEKVA